MNHIYQISDGRLISSTSLPVNRDKLKVGLAVKSSVREGIWNPKILDLEPRPSRTLISYDEFAHRVGPDRYKALKKGARVEAAAGDHSLSDLIEFIINLQTVDLASKNLSRALVDIVSAGIWTADDVGEIING